MSGYDMGLESCGHAQSILSRHIDASLVDPEARSPEAEMRDEAEGSTPPSPPQAADQQHYFPSPEKTTGTEVRPGTGKTGRSMASSFLHRRALPTPNGSNIVIPPLFRDTDEDTIDDENSSQDRSGDAEWASWIAAIRGPSGGVNSGYTGTTDPQGNMLGRWNSTSTSNPGPPKLPNALKGIWRLFLFQGIFFSLNFMASLSTTIAWATGRAVPPIASHHIALLLVTWAPVFVFGHSPGVHRQLKALSYRLLQRHCKIVH
ncbi:hypothetical protein HWV62_20019 [Athelia sp. TMB]|nr:hypothetical protein HWV62_20019 [Athelia sp. TMB]